jgi:hypothetical protein
MKRIAIGLVRDAAALCVEDTGLGQHILLVVSPTTDPRSRNNTELQDYLGCRRADQRGKLGR